LALAGSWLLGMAMMMPLPDDLEPITPPSYVTPVERSSLVTQAAVLEPSSPALFDPVGTPPATWESGFWPCEGILRDNHCRPKPRYLGPGGGAGER
jgi:hypothetical protein